jgi:hypothetical protein
MKVQSISNANSFHGTFEINPLFKKFKDELNPEQKKNFNKFIKRTEKEQDGRIFKFDKIANPEQCGGTEVGIFEKKYLIDRTLWIPLFCSTRERAAWCFDQLNSMYKDIAAAKFIKHVDGKNAKAIKTSV